MMRMSLAMDLEISYPTEASHPSHLSGPEIFIIVTVAACKQGRKDRRNGVWIVIADEPGIISYVERATLRFCFFSLLHR